MSASTIGFVRRLEPEDQARADLYALFARLYFAAPDAELLQSIGTAPLLPAEADADRLSRAWARLSAAAAVMDPDAAHDEYEALFGGVGKPLLSLFGSFYAGANAPGVGGQFLVELRAALVDLGIGVRPGQTMPEDHLSALLETMRMLVAGDVGSAPRSLAVQQAFFRKFMTPWYAECCNAIAKAPIAKFYKTVGECTSAFLTVEDESFAIA